MNDHLAIENGTQGTAAARKTRSLMIVDDDPSVRHALWITFRDYYHVTLAENGNGAIELFSESPADVAVLDIRMPGMSGLEVLKRLKEIEPGVEVVMLTAYESVESVREALRLGACDYLTKPFRVEVLREAVANAMERRDVSRKTSAYNKKLAILQEEMHHQQVREELARTRNEIYASIIHDINGPLTVIAGYIDMIQHAVRHAHTLEGDQISHLRHHASSISRQVGNCIELSRRYLGFLEGKTNSPSETGIKEIFYDVAELLKAYPQARVNELVIQPFKQDVMVRVHSTDLLQVLVNLTVNALQCSPDPHRVELYAKILPAGGPRPFAQTNQGTVFLPSPDFAVAQELVAISVQDNGPGMSNRTLERIFDAYFTTKPPGQGTGLGLSIVRRLVSQAGGAVHVYSHQGEGTVFTVYFPVKTEAPAAQPSAGTV